MISQKLKNALGACAAANVVVVAAVGNSGTGTDYWPAVDESVIAVAATDPLDRRHVDSTTGSHVFIGAPGENILTVHGIDAYARPNGTSFAAPFVTAAVWLAKRARKGLDNNQIRTLLSRSVADPTRQRDEKIGFGRLDMKRLVAVLPTV